MIRDPDQPLAHGFTLLEVMVTVTLLTTVMAIAVPQYVAVLRRARIDRANAEIRLIARAVDAFRITNGQLPVTLHQVGYGGRVDPWGVPYCFFNYDLGTGDGLEWGLAAGLIDPAAVIRPEDVAASEATETGGAAPKRIGALRHPPRLAPQGKGKGEDEDEDRGRKEAEKAAQASAAAEKLEARLAASAKKLKATNLENLRAALATAGTFAVYTDVVPETTRRRDGFMFPVNSDYDLFSLGPDGRTAVSLGSQLGKDDILRANNGGYFGPASAY